MGIPSYYKKLCDRIPGLLSRKGGGKPTHLWIDFNCMVYHCIRRPGAKPYGGEDTRIEWEDTLIAEVCKYLKKIVSIVNPSEQVFIGIDGVVPMAKMRQQRLRRFKSHWVASEEVRIGKTVAGCPRWDTNAITPGTAFMDRLGGALKGLTGTRGGVKWILSDANEPGEGEHKAMQGMRSVDKKECHVIYGLDADLIVLALLQPIKELYLFREAVECGEVQYKDDEEEYRYFSIHKLRETLCEGRGSEADAFLLDYCMSMCFLGNDFLPHGMSLKIKDGGHDILIQMLQSVYKKGVGNLIVNGSWNYMALVACIEWLASSEQSLIEKHCASKLNQKSQHPRGTTPVELAVDEWNKIPLRQCEEFALVKAFHKNGGESRVVLVEDWKRIYYERWFGVAVEGAGVQRIVYEYLVGLDWILQYYTGKEVNKEWCFPWLLPPLWSDILSVLISDGGKEVVKAPKPLEFNLKPQEQLTLVLPLESWWLIRDPILRRIPHLAPHLWPTAFDLFTAGHKQTWECEAQIPLFTPSRLRYLLSNGKQTL
jgi:5'-3' exonuclease